MSSKTYPRRQLSRNGPHVSAIGYGTMAIGAFYGKTDKDEAFKTLTYAADRGVTFWDTADCYGDSEAVIGQWLKETGRHSDIILATKFGYQNQDLQDRKPYSKPSYIRKALERSLKNLQTDYIDIWYQQLEG
ncbi:hypothetical protein M422DRAFT_267639 [Sphaerobolus stellatus SS14]|uniref:NADP-dependent oxidoreductase domain-containing protein n=1 Tax=Sphaerobolus stellatus (strain SS14) TaxID=990650 RepID=A0A0C9TLN5_SPHS4|nr:hypothetical protein M422DRAFT_267639 [Sphaerobolus stellatus SS14]